MYVAPSMESYERYQTNHAARLQAEHEGLFKESVVAFRTMLEVVEDFVLKIN
jgi:hypothetical protein